MKYNLVLNDNGWVMSDLVEHINESLPSESYISTTPSDTDINFYFNWHGFSRKFKFDVCFFTHIENGQRTYWDSAAINCDVCVAMGNKYLDTLAKHKTVRFDPPAFKWFVKDKKFKILVVGREYDTGRKHFNIKYALETIDNLEVTFTEGKMSREELLQAYRDTDYVLVTSKIEAGPMCVVEAIAMGKPVIAPDVGWCWDYPVIKYVGDYGLLSTIESIIPKKDGWQKRVAKLDRDIKGILNV